MQARVVGAILASAAGLLKLAAGFLPLAVSEASGIEFIPLDFSQGEAWRVLVGQSSGFAVIGLFWFVAFMAIRGRQGRLSAGILLGIGIVDVVGGLGGIIGGPGEGFITGVGSHAHTASGAVALAAGYLLLLDTHSREAIEADAS